MKIKKKLSKLESDKLLCIVFLVIHIALCLTLGVVMAMGIIGKYQVGLIVAIFFCYGLAMTIIIYFVLLACEEQIEILNAVKEYVEKGGKVEIK